MPGCLAADPSLRIGRGLSCWGCAASGTVTGSEEPTPVWVRSHNRTQRRGGALRRGRRVRDGVARELDPATVIAKPITIIRGDPRVDLLTLEWSVRYADVEPSMLRLRIEDVEVPVADLDTLIRSKATGRLQDRADLETLETLKRLRSG
jgi:hypothetical protein